MALAEHHEASSVVAVDETGGFDNWRAMREIFAHFLGYSESLDEDLLE
jgi:hypothetical protein